MNSIEVKDLSKSYKVTQALDGVSLQFEKGKLYGLLGRNGAGKSTLIKIITNRIFATSGEVTVDGQPVQENERMRELIFFMSEENFYSNLKVSQIFKYTKVFYSGFDMKSALLYAKSFELPTDKKFAALSTGYKNILKLIIALCQNTPYVIYDEPVVGLDAYHRELFYKLLLQNFADKEQTVILATHLIEEVQNIIEEVVIIDEGKVIVQDSVQGVLDMGFSVAGAEVEVQKYLQGKNVIDVENIGGLTVAYILGQPEDIPAGLTVSKLTLQKVFIRLTAGRVAC